MRVSEDFHVQPVTSTRQALLLWLAFFACALVLNGTVPFLLGIDMRAWTASDTKRILFPLLIYAGLFLFAPILLVKGWKTMRQPGFLFPLLVAAVAVSLWSFFRGIAVLAVLIYAYLHWRYDLSELGFRSNGWKGDLVAVGILVLINLIPAFWKMTEGGELGPAVLAGLDRLFANPASTVENVLYFGFLAPRLALKTGRWLAAPLTAGLYVCHEMTNPEYWYSGISFVLVFFGIWITASVALWRKSMIPIWLGDGLGRIASRLF